MAFNYTANGGDSDWRVVVLNHSNVTRHSSSAGVISINYRLSEMVALAAALSVLIVFTTLGNLLVLVALFRYRGLRTISNCLIGNLAASDFLLAVTVLPFSATTECLGYWAFGRVACSVWLVVDVLCCTASIWNLSASGWWWTSCAAPPPSGTSQRLVGGGRPVLHRLHLEPLSVWLVVDVLCCTASIWNLSASGWWWTSSAAPPPSGTSASSPPTATRRPFTRSGTATEVPPGVEPSPTSASSGRSRSPSVYRRCSAGTTKRTSGSSRPGQRLQSWFSEYRGKTKRTGSALTSPNVNEENFWQSATMLLMIFRWTLTSFQRRELLHHPAEMPFLPQGDQRDGFRCRPKYKKILNELVQLRHLW